MSDALLPPDVYYASLPKHVASGAMLIRDQDDRVLLVQPTYRDDTWEIPGGALAPDEHPWQTAHREVEEEIGLSIRPGQLLAVDWTPPRPDGRPALFNFVFDGGRLTSERAKDIRLQQAELQTWRFCDIHEASTLLIARMADRVSACLDALRTGTTAYLHAGRPVGP